MKQRAETVLLVSALLLTSCQSSLPPTPIQDVPRFATYANREAGISLEYPRPLTVEDDLLVERDDYGNLITTTTVLLHSGQFLDSGEASLFIMVRALEDPYMTAIDWYPPHEEALLIYAAMDLGELAAEDREENTEEVMAAMEDVVYTEISGFPAATYSVSIDRTTMGQMYVRGAAAISPKRLYTIMVIGSIEPDAPGAVTERYVDEVWARVVESIWLVDP